MIAKSYRLFGSDHAPEQILRAKSRFKVKRFRFSHRQRDSERAVTLPVTAVTGRARGFSLGSVSRLAMTVIPIITSIPRHESAMTTKQLNPVSAPNIIQAGERFTAHRPTTTVVTAGVIRPDFGAAYWTPEKLRR